MKILADKKAYRKMLKTIEYGECGAYIKNIKCKK